MTTITSTATTPANKPERVLYKTDKGHAVGDVIFREKRHYEVVSLGETYGGTRYREMGRWKTSDRLIETFIRKASAAQIAVFEDKKAAEKRAKDHKRAFDRKFYARQRKALEKLEAMDSSFHELEIFPEGRRIHLKFVGVDNCSLIAGDDGWLWEIWHGYLDHPGKAFGSAKRCRRFHSTTELIAEIEYRYDPAA